MVRKEDKVENTFLPSRTFLPGSPSLLCSQLLCLSSPGDGKWGLWSICNRSSLLFIPHHILQELQENPCSGIWTTFPPPLLRLVLSGLFLTLFPSFLTAGEHFALPYPGLPQGAAVMVVGLSWVLQWVCWSWLEPAVSGMGMLTEAALQTTPARSGYLHLAQHLSKLGHRKLNPCWGLLHRRGGAQDFCNELYGLHPLLKTWQVAIDAYIVCCCHCFLLLCFQTPHWSLLRWIYKDFSKD